MIEKIVLLVHVKEHSLRYVIPSSVLQGLMRDLRISRPLRLRVCMSEGTHVCNYSFVERGYRVELA